MLANCRILAMTVLFCLTSPLLLTTRPLQGDAIPGTSRSQLTEEEAARAVSFHNTLRREVGVAPVVWSPELADFAQAWADELARRAAFEHRPPDGPWAQRYGENIAISGGRDDAVNMALHRWAEERADYAPGDAIPADFAEFRAGHYTQMVWRGTTHLGLGKATVATGEWAGRTIIVANYDPAGNRVGEKPYEQ